MYFIVTSEPLVSKVNVPFAVIPGATFPSVIYLLSSVLTIKHIGGIIYVANAITLILQRLTHIANQSVFIAR